MAVHQSLELEDASCQDDGHIRTGTLWTCVAHIITAVIGSGVLSLAWSTAQLGWVAGPIAMLCFAVVTYVSAFLLSDCYRSPHPVTGARNYSYMVAVRVNLGQKRTWVCGFLQYLSMYGTGIAYTITTSISMRAVQKSDCYHREGHNFGCSYGTTLLMLLFAAVQIVLSQIPDFYNMEWLSVLAAIMYDDRFVMVGFDSDPTADFEPYNKLDRSSRDKHESKAIMKSFVVNGSDPTKPEKFLAYMVPELDELTKDMHDESEDLSYFWVRGDDADDPTTYLVNFGEKDARYLPLPTKLVLQKKKAKEGRSGDGIEHFPAPSRVTVRKRSSIAVGELKEPARTSSKHV